MIKLYLTFLFVVLLLDKIKQDVKFFIFIAMGILSPAMLFVRKETDQILYLKESDFSLFFIVSCLAVTSFYYLFKIIQSQGDKKELSLNRIEMLYLIMIGFYQLEIQGAVLLILISIKHTRYLEEKAIIHLNTFLYFFIIFLNLIDVNSYIVFALWLVTLVLEVIRKSTRIENLNFFLLTSLVIQNEPISKGWYWVFIPFFVIWYFIGKLTKKDEQKIKSLSLIGFLTGLKRELLLEFKMSVGELLKWRFGSVKIGSMYLFKKISYRKDILEFVKVEIVYSIVFILVLIYNLGVLWKIF